MSSQLKEPESVDQVITHSDGKVRNFHQPRKPWKPLGSIMLFRFKSEVSIWSSRDINLYKFWWIHQLSTEQPHWVVKKEVLNRVWDEWCHDEGTGSDRFRPRRFWPTEIASPSFLTAPGKKCRQTDRRSKSPFSMETPKRSLTKEWWGLTLGHKYAAGAPKQPSNPFHWASQHPSIGDLLTLSVLRSTSTPRPRPHTSPTQTA